MSLKINKKSSLLLIFILLLAIHFALSVLAIFAKSPSFDESVHLSGGYTYWILNDYRINPENGNFPQRWAALPLLLKDNIHLPLESVFWRDVKEWFFSYTFIFKSGNNPNELFHSAKLMILFLSLALCVAIFLIAKEIFSYRGALISLALSAFSPTILAHSNIVSSDMAVALFFTLSTYFLWKNFSKINLTNTLLCAMSLAGLFLSKMSAPIIIPLYLLIILIRLRSRGHIICEFRKRRIILEHQSQKIKAIAVVLAVHVLAVYAAIWAAYGFRQVPAPEGSPSAGVLALQWNELLKDNDGIEKIIISVDKFGLLPRAYLYGYLYVKKHIGRRLAFMDGEKSPNGFTFFFPRCFLLKTPIATLILIFASIFLLLRRREGWDSSLLSFAIFASIFAIFAISSTINIGHRHLLPLYPALFIFCGVLGEKKSMMRIFSGLCIIWLAFESVASMPNHLSYFNQIAGGSANGYKHFVDSSLDWGQDLKELKKLENKLRIEKKVSTNFYLSYFGTASINSYELDEIISLPSYFTQENFSIHRYKKGYYCVSATMLYLLYYPDILGALKFPPEILFDDSLEKLTPFIDDLFAMAEKGDIELRDFIQKNGEDFCMRRYRAFDLIRFARLCEYLKKREPDYRAGFSILVYELNEDELVNAMKMKVKF